jgi:hypothetical protein
VRINGSLLASGRRRAHRFGRGLGDFRRHGKRIAQYLLDVPAADFVDFEMIFFGLRDEGGAGTPLRTP